jgi:hypothetical protein
MPCTACRVRRGYRNWPKLTCAAVITAIVLVSTGARQAGNQGPLDVAGLRVIDDGISRINLDVTPEIGARASLNEAKGAPGITMAIKPNGDKTLLFSNIEKDRYIGINLLSNGGAAISLFSSSRQGIKLLAAEDATTLDFVDKNGKVRIRLGLQKDDSPNLEFLDKDGKVTFSAAPQ